MRRLLFFRASRAASARGLWLLVLGLGLGCAALRPPPRKYEAPDERFVLFATSRVDVTPESLFTLGYVAGLLDANPGFHVLAVGHADQTGPSEFNRDLSFRRTRAVRKALVDNGVKEARIETAIPREAQEATMRTLSRRVDLLVYDPSQEDATRRLGYPVEIRKE